MATRYVFRRVTTVTVLMAEPYEIIASAREWAEQALSFDDFAEDFVTVEHGPVELIDKRAGEEGGE